MAGESSLFSSLLKKDETFLLSQWTDAQARVVGTKISNEELKAQCKEFLGLLVEATQADSSESTHGSAWAPAKKMLADISRSRTLQGFTPTETAIFVFSLKKPLFDLAKKELGGNSQELVNVIWSLTQRLDQLGLYTAEMHQKSREEVIVRQQEDMLELSTPVVKLWDGILALPMIGTLDSSRTQVVMESLLQKIVETESEIAIIDITGVPTVDTLVAQHLIKTVTAARLMGAECIISGIRPQIAATIVHLGVDLGTVATKSTLADAFKLALSRTGKSVGKADAFMHREIRT